MPHSKLVTILRALKNKLDKVERFAIAARRWAYPAKQAVVPKFTIYHKDLVIEMAFLRAYSAWESFLEESFILYLWGKSPPLGTGPRRYANPPTRKIAERLVLSEGRDYADWSEAQNVVKRAERFFEEGQPYSDALRSQQSRLQDIKTIRNAIAHSSSFSWERFQILIRRELSTFPPGLTIGSFLDITVLGISPPISYFEHYVSVIRLVANAIVPN